MRRLVLPAVATLLALSVSGPVGASGDYGCYPAWKLPSRDFDCADRAVLSPGNDSRVNLFYLLRDRQGLGSTGAKRPTDNWNDGFYGSAFFDWRQLRGTFYPAVATDEADGDYAGSRCVSLASGGQAFAAAMTANGKLSAWEREQLLMARGGLVRRCQATGAEATGWPANVKSAPGREFLGYLQAADAFYGEQWDAARQGFATLRSARDPWVAETAAYMLGRTELNAAQAAAFDEYGSFAGPAKVDTAALARASAGFQDYLKRYARGRYAASAGGLRRRTLWLAGDAAALSREYERLLAATPGGQKGAADLVEEIDNKLLIAARAPDGLDGPLLLATLDLMMMRSAEGSERPVITAAQIAAQESRFVGRADLFGFVTASHAYYVAGDMRRVLQLIPDAARQPRFSALEFSRQVLRGMALAGLRDRNEAGFWREMLGGVDPLYQRPIVELALAQNWERGGKLREVFAPGSPITDAGIREILLIQVADAALLRAQARAAQAPRHERDVALFTLLYKQLSRGDYAGFLGDYALLRSDAKAEGGLWNLRQQEDVPVGLFRAGTWSDGYACPALRTTVQALARNPRDVKARLCLGDFYRLNGFDDYGADGSAPKPDELGGTPTRFAGRPVPRAALYADIIADAAAPAGDKAYALYRAVNCYAPNGNNACGGADVPQSQRRAWFQRLKTDHAASPWAQKLRYYW